MGCQEHKLGSGSFGAVYRFCSSAQLNCLSWKFLYSTSVTAHVAEYTFPEAQMTFVLMFGKMRSRLLRILSKSHHVHHSKKSYLHG
eukprot:2584217-Amphidinium_carterae.1